MGFKKNDDVIVKSDGKRGRITGRTRELIPGQLLYEVNIDNRLSYKTESQLESAPLEMMDMSECFLAHKFRTFREYQQLIIHLRLMGQLNDIIYSMKYGDVDFLPHQFKPVFKFLSAKTGHLLIADEVGLGKTIEALYIWRELQARSGAKRLLVVAPSVLTTKWEGDMRRHFGIQAEIVRAGELNIRIQEAEIKGGKIFELVASIQGIRMNDGAAEFSPIAKLHATMTKAQKAGRKLFDLVIIDEAHSLVNRKSCNHQLAKLLRDVSENLILLSATPVNNKSADLYHLLSLLSPDEFLNMNLFERMFRDNALVVRLSRLLEMPSRDISQAAAEAEELLVEIGNTQSFHGDRYFEGLKGKMLSIFSSDMERRETYDRVSSRFFYSEYITRSRKRDVMKTCVREAISLDYSLSPFSAGIYDDCTEWIEDRLYSSADPFSDKRNLYPFVLLLRQRQMDSSIPACIAAWRETLRTNIEQEDDALLEDDLGGIGPNIVVSTATKTESIPDIIQDFTDEDIIRLEGEDHKYQKFFEAIQQRIASDDGTLRKVIVFSFFKATIAYLARRLNADGVKTAVIMGNMKTNDETLIRFRDDKDIHVLLATEVGAEGIDMQFVSTEINYDLPWNPMRLEQRIGRIDRIGQKAEKIFILNLYCHDMISDRIRKMLFEKIRIFQDSIGSIDEIVGSTIKKLERDSLSPYLSPEQKRQQAELETNAMYNDILMRRALEEQAGISKAFSDRILDYVNEINRNNKYIRREDLINYIRAFVETEANGTDFRQDRKTPELWHLVFSQQDRNEFQDFCIKNNLSSDISHYNDVLCSFPQGRRDLGTCALDVNHPIIKWISSKNAKLAENATNAFCIGISKDRIDSKRFDEKYYVYYILEAKFEGLRKNNELISICVGADSGKACSRNDSDNLLGTVLFDGHNIDNLRARISDTCFDRLAVALESCKRCVGEEFARLAARFKDDNMDLLTRTKNMLEQHYQVQIDRVRASIVNAYSEQKQDSVIKRFKTRIQSLEAERNDSIRDLEKRGQVSIDEFTEIAVGVICIDQC